MRIQAGVTREAIAEEALALLDEANDESALTMRALAARLGVQAPSLYAHISGIDEILGLVHERINQAVDLSLAPSPADETSLRAFLCSYREAYRSHPVAAALIMSRSINADHALAVYEVLARALLDLGVPLESVMPLMATCDALVVGSAAEPFAAGFVEGPLGSVSRFPNVAAALEAIDRRRIDDAGFEIGLDAFFGTIREFAAAGRAVPGAR